MGLQENEIFDFLAFYHPQLDENAINEKAENFKKKNNDLRNCFVIKENNHIVQACFLFETEQGNYAFSQPRLKGKQDVSLLVSRVIERFKELKGKNLHCRLVHQENYKDLESELLKLDFKKVGERVEYKTPLDQIHVLDGSPIKWQAPLVEGSYSLEELAKIMELVSEDSPNFNEDDDALACIKSYLNDESLYHGADCLQLGFIDGHKDPACFIVAQTDQRVGWSTITYMGVAPKFRGQGLAKWVQLHGISMLKKQGGKTYHGGTNALSVAMVKTFESNGCQFFCQMSEFIL